MDRTSSSKCDTYTDLSRTFRSNYFPRIEYDWTTHTKSTYTNQFQHNVYRPNVVSYSKKKDWLTNWSEKNACQSRSDRLYDDRRRYKEKPVKVKLPKLPKRERTNSKQKPIEEKKVFIAERKDSTTRRTSVSSHENVKLPPLERWRNLVSPKRTSRIDEKTAVNEDNNNADLEINASIDDINKDATENVGAEDAKPLTKDDSQEQAREELRDDHEETEGVADENTNLKIDKNDDEVNSKQSKEVSGALQEPKEGDEKPEEAKLSSDTQEGLNENVKSVVNEGVSNDGGLESNERDVDILNEKRPEEIKQLPTELTEDKQPLKATDDELHSASVLENQQSTSIQSGETVLGANENNADDLKEMVHEDSMVVQTNTENSNDESHATETEPIQFNGETVATISAEKGDETIKSENPSEEQSNVQEEKQESLQETDKDVEPGDKEAGENAVITKEEPDLPQESKQTMDDKHADETSLSENISDEKYSSKEHETSVVEMVSSTNPESAESGQSSSDNKTEEDASIESNEMSKQSRDETSASVSPLNAEREQNEERNADQKQKTEDPQVESNNEKITGNATLLDGESRVDVSDDVSLKKENIGTQQMKEDTSQIQNTKTENEGVTVPENIVAEKRGEQADTETQSNEENVGNTNMNASIPDNNEAVTVEKVIGSGDISPGEQIKNAEESTDPKTEIVEEEKRDEGISESHTEEQNEDTSNVESSIPDNNESVAVEKIASSDQQLSGELDNPTEFNDVTVPETTVANDKRDEGITESQAEVQNEDISNVESSIPDNNESVAVEKIASSDQQPSGELDKPTEFNESTVADDKRDEGTTESPADVQNEDISNVESSIPDNNESVAVEKIASSDQQPSGELDKPTEFNEVTVPKSTAIEDKHDEGITELQTEEASKKTNEEAPAAETGSDEISSEKKEEGIEVGPTIPNEKDVHILEQSQATENNEFVENEKQVKGTPEGTFVERSQNGSTTNQNDVLDVSNGEKTFSEEVANTDNVKKEGDLSTEVLNLEENGDLNIEHTQHDEKIVSDDQENTVSNPADTLANEITNDQIVKNTDNTDKNVDNMQVTNDEDQITKPEVSPEKKDSVVKENEEVQQQLTEKDEGISEKKDGTFVISELDKKNLEKQ